MRDFLSQRSPNPTTSHLLSPTPSSSFEVKASPFSVGIRQVKKGMKGKRGTWEITGMGGMGKKLMENQRWAVLIRDLREVEEADLIHPFLKTKKSFTNQGILRKKLLRGCSSHMSILQFFCLPWPTKNGWQLNSKNS
ncbi:hypothetical protein RchiOBHm_Chr4g0387731 [Rosa chinensis]|uniref:Uncharacterized protein n=1 Tax=Rosa chinensis TaxID=74649 RepID=A0A2P6QPJ6_ROSCH|nr:hypothetical protein RchiOBHm_Chr4g0387731 [Rosa chinensis]